MVRLFLPSNPRRSLPPPHPIISISLPNDPQTNFRRKTTAGFSPDFLLANIFGFTSYTLYAGLLLFSPTVRHEYADRHSGKPPAVQLNDFAFGVHAVAVELIVLSQFLLPRLWGIQDRARLPVSWAMGGICTACTAWLVIQCVARGPGLDFVRPFAPFAPSLRLLTRAGLHARQREAPPHPSQMRSASVAQLPKEVHRGVRLLSHPDGSRRERVFAVSAVHRCGAAGELAGGDGRQSDQVRAGKSVVVV